MSSQNTEPEAATPAITLGIAFALCMALIAFFIVVDLLFFAQGQSFKREGGGLENVSAVLYIVAAVVFFVTAPRILWVSLFHVPTLMLLFAAREMDMDKSFTEAGILSIKMYSGGAGITAKVIAGTIALFCVYIILRNVWRGFPAALRAIRERKIWPWFAILAAGLVVGTKSIDGLGRKLLDFNIVISEDLDSMASLYEEVGEVFIPVCAILAIIACFRGAKT